MLWQQIINGLTLGSTYALIALGYTMVYGIIQLINFAHGEIYMVGAFVGVVLITIFNLNIWISMLLAMLTCMIMGIIIERIAYRPLRKSSRLASLISAIGVSIFLQSLMTLINGPQPVAFPDVFEDSLYTIGPIEISAIQIIILVISSLLMLGLQLTIKYTKIGKAMRATSEDYSTASLMGINVNRVISFTFAIGSSLAAAGGVLVGIYWKSVAPLMGVMVGLKAFVAAVLGGIGSIPGAMLGGVFLGLAETFTIAAKLDTYKDAVAFTLLIIILLFKPTGLLGRAIQKKV